MMIVETINRRFEKVEDAKSAAREFERDGFEVEVFSFRNDDQEPYWKVIASQTHADIEKLS